MILQFDKSIAQKNPTLFDLIESKSLLYPVYYILDSRLRDASNLSNWLAESIDNPSDELVAACKGIDTTQDPDYIMTDVLRLVHSLVTYTPDSKIYKTPEKWQTPKETLTLKTGDCEDGAILIYCMARHLGVPSNRLLLFAGDVAGGGHCWCGYRATEYPLNWAFMDWCYWYDSSTPGARPKYYIKDNIIYDDVLNRYLKIWFAFNEDKSYKGINNATA